MSLLEEDLSEARVDVTSHSSNCDRCLTLPLLIQELLTTVKLLSERVQELESDNDDLSTRLELLESHGTPESPPNNLESNLMASAMSAAHGTDENDSDRN